MFSIYIIFFISLVALAKYVIVPLIFSNKTEHNSATTSRYRHIDPILGLDLAVQTWREFKRGELCEGLRKRHVQYGPTFTTNGNNTLFGGGAAETIYTTEPENIRTVTTHEFSKFGKAAWVGEAAKHIGAGVLLNEGGAWKHSRTMLKPMFARGAAAAATMDDPAMLEPHVQSLVQQMRRQAHASRRGVFDFHELASMFTLDVVTEFLFGKSSGTLESPHQGDGEEGMHFLSLVKDFEGPSAQFIAVGPLAWFGLITSYKRLIGMVDGMKAFFKKKLNDIIAETSQSGDGCCTDAVQQQQQQQPKHSRRDVSPSIFRSMKNGGVADDQIQGELQNIFFASYDTTSTFLANLMYVLVRHPDVQQRIRNEITVLEGRAPTSKELARMPFLRMVINEVSSHSRSAKVDATLPRGGGPDGQSPMVVRAGTTIVWSTYALNRDPRTYGEDWAEFRPDRWASLLQVKSSSTVSTTTTTTTTTTVTTQEAAEDTTAATTTTTIDAKRESEKMGSTTAAGEIGEGAGGKRRSAFMPFGSGPRTCLGQTMVQAEVTYVVVRLLQEFPTLAIDEADAEKPFKEAKAVSFYNEGGVRIRLS
ncbi:hypothetical protein N0V82_009633 [Gnomoniopsis sp. IMI 355080]|nr:hypothetical protein N0V82_009633 [Gnomoniopsis sp. IMI 355080]